MIKDNHEQPILPRRDLPIVNFPIDKIKVDPQKRLRQEERDYKNNPKYIALRNSIAKFGLRNPISVNSSNKKLAVVGFQLTSRQLDIIGTKLGAQMRNHESLEEYMKLIN